MELSNIPIIETNKSFASLASRIVEEAIATKTPQDLAKHVLQRVGIGQDPMPAEPQVFNGHLRHVGRRARKVARAEINNRNLRIRRVKKHHRGPPPNIRRMGAPQETRLRPQLGMEDEQQRSARDPNNQRGKSNRRRRMFKR